eukprot:TRINITY_DN6884_c0_g1_i1.p1 TRINITY_DN6884_c0_g1~~TRINITY_DN6884_c0_g1_i1.p1  ORF type:complete len:569 (-),score=74.60 TRINITY_DN6884_c0_g1_i1:186-1892(-)
MRFLSLSLMAQWVALSLLLALTLALQASSSAEDTVLAGKRKLKVLILSTSSGGHMIPVISLGQELLDRGHDVYICVPYVNPAMPGKFLAGTGLKYIPTRGATESMAEISKRNMRLFRGKMSRFLLTVRARIMFASGDGLETKYIFDSKTATTEGIKYVPEGGEPIIVKPDVIVGNHFSNLQMGNRLADLWNVPVVFNSPQVNWDPPRQPFHYPIHGANIALSEMTFWNRVVSIVWYFFDLHYVAQYIGTYYASKELQRLCKCKDQLQFLPEAGRYRPKLQNTVIGYDYPLLVGPLTIYTGPMIYPSALDVDAHRAYKEKQFARNPALKEWLAKWKSGEVTVVSMGSYGKVPDKQGIAMYKGFIASGKPTVWSLRSDNRNFIPVDHRPANGTDLIRLEEWIPQRALLDDPAVGVFVSHCGFGGSHEAMYFGKPLLCLPVMADQPEQAARLRDTGAGLTLDVDFLTPKQITDSVIRLSGETKFVENAKRVSRLMQLQGGVKKGADTVEYLAEVGSDHLVLPDFHMPFFLRYNVDVYLFLTVVIGTIVAILVQLLLMGLSLSAPPKKGKTE